MPKVSLKEQYLWSGTSYGPGETEVPESFLNAYPDLKPPPLPGVKPGDYIVKPGEFILFKDESEITTPQDPPPSEETPPPPSSKRSK